MVQEKHQTIKDTAQTEKRGDKKPKLAEAWSPTKKGTHKAGRGRASSQDIIELSKRWEA